MIVVFSTWAAVPYDFTGTACITEDSVECWFQSGKLHRVDGPAKEWPNGDKEWHLNDLYHREDGPAIEFIDGYKEWRLNSNYVYDNLKFLSLKENYIVVERGIPTDIMFGKLKLTQAKLLVAEGTVFIYDNLPGFTIGEGNE